MAASPGFEPFEITSYPFLAGPERAAAISNNYRRIELGMRPEEVSAIPGAPDEMRTVYQPRIWRPKITGYSYWYVIRRLAGSGSVNDKRESLVRIIFGLNDRVIAVDAWGL